MFMEVVQSCPSSRGVMVMRAVMREGLGVCGLGICRGICRGREEVVDGVVGAEEVVDGVSKSNLCIEAKS